MRVTAVPCLRDNFAYLVESSAPDERGGARVAVVDPGEAGPVLAALAARGLALHQVWLTHHHADHVGGLRELWAAFPRLEVIAHPRDADKARAFGAVTRTVEDGDVVELGALRASIVHNPGHTLGAISYLVAPPGRAAALFTGDTLFGAGCGRMFEGDAAMFHASLRTLAALPATTEVYFGHEYTRNNLRFAEAVVPGEPAVAARVHALEARLANGQPSTPSTIELERATNPFLRCDDAVVQAAAAARGAGAAPAEVFAALRSWKDSF